jgi:hypothetical protein
VIIPILAAAGVGVGVVLGYRSLMPASAPQQRLVSAPGARALMLMRLHPWLAARGWPGATLTVDLSLLRRDQSELLVQQVVGATIGLLGPPGIAVLAGLAGAHLSLLIPCWFAVLAAGLGAYLPVAALHREAASFRAQFRATVGVYLDLVAMRIASGSGLAEALRDAANIGRGPAFARLRGALADAPTAGISLAAAIDQLGADIGVGDLRDLAAALSLVESNGAHAEMTLRAKASSLRDRELAAVHGLANERTQSMLAAQALLGIGFLLFLGYPAVAVVAAS